MSEVERSLIISPNGDINLSVVEDVTDLEKTNAIIKQEADGFSESKNRRMNVSVPSRLYWLWANRLGEECWLDRNFLRSFMKENPQYATSNLNI